MLFMYCENKNVLEIIYFFQIFPDGYSMGHITCVQEIKN